MLWLLTDSPRRLGSLLPGAVAAALGLLALQAIGGWYVDRLAPRRFAEAARRDRRESIEVSFTDGGS